MCECAAEQNSYPNSAVHHLYITLLVEETVVLIVNPKPKAPYKFMLNKKPH